MVMSFSGSSSEFSWTFHPFQADIGNPESFRTFMLFNFILFSNIFYIEVTLVLDISVTFINRHYIHFSYILHREFKKGG